MSSEGVCRRPSAVVNLNCVTNRVAPGPRYKLSYDAEQYKTIHTLLNIPYLQPPHPTVRQVLFCFIRLKGHRTRELRADRIRWRLVSRRASWMRKPPREAPRRAAIPLVALPASGCESCCHPRYERKGQRPAASRLIDRFLAGESTSEVP